MKNFEVSIAIPNQLWSLLQYCQTCFTECCGIDAFDVNSSSVRQWLATATIAQLRTLNAELYSLEQDLAILTSECEVASSQLNFVGSPREWLQLVKTWLNILREIMNPSIENNAAIPVLACRNPEEVIRFYSCLPLEAIATYPDYVILQGCGVELHFAMCNTLDPLTTTSSCYLRVNDVEQWHQWLEAIQLPVTGTPRLTAIKIQPWGMKEFHLVDPWGNLLRIGQPLSSTE